LLPYQVEGGIKTKTKEVDENKKAYQVKKKTLDALPQSQQTAAKLQVCNTQGANRNAHIGPWSPIVETSAIIIADLLVYVQITI